MGSLIKAMDEKKKKLLAYICLLVFAGILITAVILRNLPEWPDRVMTRGGDEVVFNSPVSSGRLHLEPYEAVSEAEYAKMEPEGKGLGSEAILPENAENIGHEYRYALNETHEKEKLHDEVWTWETPVYPDARAAINSLTGRQQDRGYVKLIQYRGERPLGEEKLYSQTVIDVELRKSRVNGRTLWAVKKGREYGGCEDPGRAVYEADITDAGGDSINFYLEAENVSDDYFLNLLEILTGGEDRTADIPLISSGKGDSREDIEKEKEEWEAQERQWKEESDIARGAEAVLMDEWAEELDAGYGAGNIQRARDSNSFYIRDFTFFDQVQHKGEKAYNFKCVYDVNYPCDRADNNEWDGFSLRLTRYMLLEKDEDGQYREKGMPYIEIDEEPVEKLEKGGQARLRYTSPSQCPYVAKVTRSEVKGKSREEISLILLEQMAKEMSSQEDAEGIASGGSYLRTRDRTFLITEYEDLRIARLNKTRDKNRWIVKGDFNWKYVGYTDSYGYMGAAFPGYSRQGWISRFDKDNRFVLQELDDCYTLETIANYELREE